jgi:hypothetical protein
MSKKQAILSNDIVSLYMDYFMETPSDLQNVYHFCKLNKIEESEFYKHFSDLKQIDAHFFDSVFENTMTLLDKHEDFKNYDAQSKLASFYFTFFEILTANRSFVLHQLKGMPLKTISKLRNLKNHFTQFVDSLGIQLLEIEQEQIERIQNQGIKEASWAQFMIILNFWINDTSKGFEKTDIFIEKNLKASFDLIDTTPLKSLIDLGKFIFKENFNKS